MVGYFLSGLWTLQPWQQPNTNRVPGEFWSGKVEGEEFGRFFWGPEFAWNLVFCFLFFWGGFRQCDWRVLVYVWVIGKGLMCFFKNQIPFGHFYCCKESINFDKETGVVRFVRIL